MRDYLGVALAGVILAVASAAMAQTQEAPVAFGPADISKPGPADISKPKVTGISGQLELGREITLKVDHLSDWAATHDSQKLVPFLNGRALSGLYSEQIDLTNNEVRFHVRRTPGAKTVWTDLFHEPVLTRPVSVSIGPEHQAPFATVFDKDHPVTLTIIPRVWGIISLLIILGVIIFFVYLARTTNIVRDPGPTAEPGKYRPYNLGRVQMAFWFFLISISYVCLWLVTDNLDTIGSSELILAGISGVTALGAHVVTHGGVDTEPSTPGIPTSQGFFRDLLSDANGYRFHRFQICAWTVVLGLIFAATVYNDLKMPQFSSTLLALTGISAGTYLGFTFLETKGDRLFSSVDDR